MTQRQKVWLWLLICLGAVVIGYYHVKLIFNAVLTERGTYAYYLAISKSVAKLPVYKPSTAKPRYYYTPEDGMTPTTDALSYCASTGHADVAQFYEKYFRELGFDAQAEEWGLSFNHELEHYQLELDGDASCPAYVFVSHFPR
jgi:hypothetical protein